MTYKATFINDHCFTIQFHWKAVAKSVFFHYLGKSLRELELEFDGEYREGDDCSGADEIVSLPKRPKTTRKLSNLEREAFFRTFPCTDFKAIGN